MTRSIVMWLITANRNDVVAYLRIIKSIEDRLDIKIDLKIVSWARLYDTLVNAFREGNQPDLFALGTTWVSTFSHLGFLEPVPSSLNLPNALAPWIQECACYDGVQYAVPYNVSPLMICARQQFLDENEIAPGDLKDFAGLYNSCVKIDQNYKAAGNTEHIPFSFQVKADMNIMHFFFSFLYATGWKFPAINAGEDFELNTEELYKIFKYMNSLLRLSGNVPQEVHLYYNALYDKFYNLGQSSLYLDYSVGTVSEIMRERLQGIKADKTISIYPIPQNSENGKIYLGGCMLAVAAASRNKELAWELVRCLLEDDAVELDALLSGNVPALNTSFWKKHGDSAEIHMLEQQIKRSASYPFHPLWRNVEENLMDGIYQSFLCFNHYEEGLTYSEIDKILTATTKKVRKLLDLSWEI